MKVQLNYKYKLYVDRFSQKFYNIISVRVEDNVGHNGGESGYNCWGYELGQEAAEGTGVTFRPKWTTAGAAVDAALEEYKRPKIEMKTNG